MATTRQVRDVIVTLLSPHGSPHGAHFPTEILSVLPDGRLQLWSMQGERPQVGADDEWPQPRLVKEVLLESKADVGRLGRPIAMVTGKVRLQTAVVLCA